jgi:hypothetical protein
MKVLPVSLSFKSRNYENNYDSAYLYTKKENDCKKYSYKYAIATSVIAFSAVVVTLFNIMRNKNLPK